MAYYQILIFLNLLSIFIYIVLFVFAVIGTHLYMFAYFKMKRTRIIGSLAWLLMAISVETLMWTYVAFSHFSTGVYPVWTIHPITHIVVKGIFAFFLIRFILISIKEDVPKTV